MSIFEQVNTRLGVLLVCMFITGCAHDIIDLTGEIHGTVTDYNYGQLLSNCQVTLTPTGKSTITSTAGSFEFNDIDPGDYTLSFKKAGYVDETSRISVISGQVSEVSILLKAKSAFALSESVWDFGELETDKDLLLYNNSDSDCSYSISGVPLWLSLSKTSGSIVGGGTEVISATINRTTSDYGSFSQNITFSYAGKAMGTVTLLVRFQKVPLSLPSVSCSTGAENITKESFDIKGSITATGGSQILSYGHCYSTSPNPTTSDRYTDLGSSLQTASFT